MVWIIDRQQWPRALFRAELLERGYEAIGFVGLDAAIIAFRHGLYTRPDLIILELKDLVEAEDRIRTLAGLGIPTILLTGVVEEQMTAVRGIAWAVLLKRPFTVSRVVEEVERQIKISK